MSDQTTALAPRAADALAEDLDLDLERVGRGISKWRDLGKLLDTELADSCVDIAGKKHRTRAFHTAVAVAGNISTHIDKEWREVDGRFHDGRENFGYFFIVTATAPNGRVMHGDGCCFAHEKAESFKCPHPLAGSDWKSEHYPPETCPDYDAEFEWRRLPAEATHHNVRATACTRATNRALANLVGFGEVSAEEVMRPPHENGERDTRPANALPPRGGGAAWKQQSISEPQRKRLWTIARHHKWTDVDVHALCGRFGFEHTEDVTRGKYDEIIAILEGGTGVRE